MKLFSLFVGEKNRSAVKQHKSIWDEHERVENRNIDQWLDFSLSLRPDSVFSVQSQFFTLLIAITADHVSRFTMRLQITRFIIQLPSGFVINQFRRCKMCVSWWESWHFYLHLNAFSRWKIAFESFNSILTRFKCLKVFYGKQVGEKNAVESIMIVISRELHVKSIYQHKWFH